MKRIEFRIGRGSAYQRSVVQDMHTCCACVGWCARAGRWTEARTAEPESPKRSDGEARGGVVMTIASTLAFQPAPFAATYAATKAFVLHWTLALNEELRGSRVRAIAVCPGTTDTGFFRTAGVDQPVARSRVTLTPDEVARAALEAVATGRGLIVPGLGNKLYTSVSARLPKVVAAKLAGNVLKRRRSRGASN